MYVVGLLVFVFYTYSLWTSITSVISRVIAYPDFALDFKLN